MTAPRLRMTGIRKSYGPTPALRGVDLELLPGEVHASGHLLARIESPELRAEARPDRGLVDRNQIRVVPQLQGTRNMRKRFSTRPFVCGLGILALFHTHHRTLLSLVGLQDFFAKPQRLGRDFHKFIISDELNSLLQIQVAKGNQADGHIRG